MLTEWHQPDLTISQEGLRSNPKVMSSSALSEPGSDVEEEPSDPTPLELSEAAAEPSQFVAATDTLVTQDPRL